MHRRVDNSLGLVAGYRTDRLGPDQMILGNRNGYITSISFVDERCSPCLEKKCGYVSMREAGFTLCTRGPWPPTNGWFALLSGIAACPLLAWSLKKYAGISVSGWLQFAASS
jgi:hypothetical protein